MGLICSIVKKMFVQSVVERLQPSEAESEKIEERHGKTDARA